MGRAFKNKALVSPIWNGDMNGSNFTDLAGTGASAYLPLTQDGFGHYTKHDAGVLSVVPVEALDKQIDFSTLHTDVDNSRYFDGLNGEKHIAYSGNHIALNEDGDTGQSVPYPVIHTLGADIADGSTVTLEASSNDSKYLTLTPAPAIGSTVVLEYEVTANTLGGDATFTQYGNVNAIYDTNTSEIPSTVGIHTIEYVVANNGIHNAIQLRALVNTTGTGNISIAYQTVKEITIPATSFLSYFDVATKSRLQSVPSISTTYEMITSHSDYMTSTKALTVAELAQCDANSDSIYNVWFNGHTLTDGFVKIDIVNYFPVGFNNDSATIEDVSVV